MIAQQLINRTARKAWIVAFCPLLVAAYGCNDKSRVAEEGKLRAQTLLGMTSVSTEIRRVCAETGESPPQDIGSLVPWLRRHSAQLSDSVLIQDGMLIDGWGNSLRLVRREDSLIQVGSAGRNGQWENGGGDDLVGPEIDPSKYKVASQPWLEGAS